MKNAKTALTAFAAFLMFSVAASAQTKEIQSTGIDQKSEITPKAKSGAARLNLTDEQKTAYREISKTFNEKLQAIRNSDAISVEKVKQADAAREERNTAFQKILTPEQFTTFKEIEAERKSRMIQK